MLIALSGRKGSGKSLLAQELVKRSFIKIGFAGYLKEIVSKLYDWKLDDLYDPIKKEELLESKVVWDETARNKLSEIIEQDIDLKVDEKIFTTTREALTYIGTDVLRSLDTNFHVKKTLLFIKPDENYVLDDCRFPNELEAIKLINGAIPIFVLRPNNFVYSNHPSEISLNRNDFEYIIMNDGSKHKLLRKFNIFVDNLFANKNEIDRKELQFLLENNNYNTGNVSKILNCKRSKIISYASKHSIYIPRSKYKINNDCFSHPAEQTSYWAGLLSADGCIKKNGNSYILELKSTDCELVEGFQKFLQTTKKFTKEYPEINGKGKVQFCLSVRNGYIIDDLKLWDLRPKKSKCNKIPSIIKNNDELLKWWIVGLIDGDGCISRIRDGKSIIINCLASEEIVDFIIFKYPNGRKFSTGVSNLYKFVFTGKFAVDFYQSIYKGFGLKRKWSKMHEYTHKVWRS